MKDLLDGSEWGMEEDTRGEGVSEYWIGRDEVRERSGTCAVSGLLQHKHSWSWTEYNILQLHKQNHLKALSSPLKYI